MEIELFEMFFIVRSGGAFVILISRDRRSPRWLYTSAKRSVMAGRVRVIEWKKGRVAGGVSIVSVHCCSTNGRDEFRSKMLLVIVGPMHETIGSIRRWLASIPLPPFDQSPSRSLFDRKTHHGDHDWMSGRVNDGGRFWKSVVQQSDKSVESKDWLEWVWREFDFLVEEFVTRTKNFWRRKEGLLYIPSYKEI